MAVDTDADEAFRIHALLEVSLPSCAHGFRKGEFAQTTQTLCWPSGPCMA